jgi:2-oxoglutarate ferredoxin oxidoreductase subunit gamma
MQTEVMLTGIGGQGVQLCAKALAMAAIAEGRQAMLSAHYGGEMRGGQTEASVVLADADLRSLPILPSTWSAFVMHPQFWPEIRSRLRPGGVVVANDPLVPPDEAIPTNRWFAIAAADIATSLSAPMSAGFVLLGAYAVITGMVGVDSLVDAMKQLVPPYRTQHLAANEAALRAGATAAPVLGAPAWTAPARAAVGVGGS